MDIRRRPPNPTIKVSNLEYSIPHLVGEPRNILEKIVWEKERELCIARSRISLDELKSKIFEIGINYHGRNYNEGKKIRYYDVFSVIYWIFITKIKKSFS